MSPTEAPQRRQPRWQLRRIESDLPRHMRHGAPSVEHPTHATDLHVVRDTPTTMTGLLLLLEIPATRTRERAIEADFPEHWRSGIILGPGGTVALDSVNPQRAAERPLLRLSPTSRPPASAPRQKRPLRSKLSLAERLMLVLQPPLDLLLEPAGALEWPGELYPLPTRGRRCPHRA